MNTFLTQPPAFICARRRDRHACLAAVTACFTTFGLAGTLGAATLTVDSLSDSGPGSLRDSIARASAGDTIQLQVTGTIQLTSGELYIDRDLTITGPGASKLAISGNHASRVFDIAHGATAAISGVTIENGTGPSTGFTGGDGILNMGTLTITNCAIVGNSAVITGNYGGGIFNNQATLTLVNSTVAGNSSTLGGGIANVSGKLTVKNSAVSGNSAGHAGGGIFNQSDNTEVTFSLMNSTLSGNSANNLGGGIAVFNGQFTMTSSTVADNTASSAGGIYNLGATPGSTIAAVLLASNSGGGNCSFDGAVTSQGYNISDDNSCAAILTAAGDENNVLPGAGLDPKGLQGNGGPTQTITLLPTSPAVDHVPVGNCSDANGQPLSSDQRGITRPQGTACDTGAYELVQTVPFANFSAHLAIGTGKPAGFVLTSTFTLGSASAGLQPASEAMTLAVGSYTLTLPAGSFHPLWNTSNAPYLYTGTVNGVKLALSVISLGGNRFQFDVAGSPVTFSGVQNPVPVSLTFGQDSGTTSVNALITPY